MSNTWDTLMDTFDKKEREIISSNFNGSQIVTIGEGFYTGQLFDGEIHGFGKITIHNQYYYIGNWKKGKMSGEGYYSRPAFRYYGEWHNDEYHGFGRLIFRDGDIYIGDWVNGEMHGKMMVLYKSGETYIGHYKNNERCGYGEYTFTNDDRYFGGWKDGKYHGFGTLHSGSIKYIGKWNNHTRDGRFTIIFPSGNIVCGIFKDGKKEGIFYFYNKSENAYYEERYENDELKGFKKIFHISEHDLITTRFNFYKPVQKSLPPAINESQRIDCLICMEYQRNVLLYPCKHVVVCSICACKINECPICRKKIGNRATIFLS